MSRKSIYSKNDSNIPEHLKEALWFRSRESTLKDGLFFDPIAANVCRLCQVKQDEQSTLIAQRQLLHAALTCQCDRIVQQFLSHYPEGWVINVEARLDTRFYRLDNGRCHWIEVDGNDNLILRQKLFHPSERYQQVQGSVTSIDWLVQMKIPEHTPVLIICDSALLDCSLEVIHSFVRSLGYLVPHAEVCFNLAGDKTQTWIGQRLGSVPYGHGIAQMDDFIKKTVPWVGSITQYTPLDAPCKRWKRWQQWLSHLDYFKYRYTPVTVSFGW